MTVINKKDYDPDSPEAQACRSLPVGIATLASSPTNPRKTFDDADMAEMIESVKAHGILQPILVRAWPTDYSWQGDMPLYEVVAGERRYRAAKAAGLALIPAMVRTLTTREVLEIQVIENLQRKDLHQLEEAEGYELMMRDHGYSAESLADKIGKSRSYIFGRLKLLQLDDEARRLFRGGLLNPSTALLVARIPTAKLRSKAIQEITEKDYNGDTMSVRKAQRLLQQRFMLRLAEASFPTNDGSLAGGDCQSCLKRTGNQPADLFEDVDSPDVCTDPDCFVLKKQAWMERQAEWAKASGIKVIAGEEAEKEGRYGFEHSDPASYTRLDSKCYDDPEQRTYREILGDDVETALIEDTHNHKMVGVVKNTVLADKLKEAGVTTQKMKDKKERQKVEATITLEKAIRERVFANVRTEIANYTMEDTPEFPAEILLTLLRSLVVMVFRRVAYDDAVLRALKLWDVPGDNATARKKAFPEIVSQATASQCWRYLVDLMLAGEISVNEYSLSHDPERLNEFAAAMNIDVVEVRKDVVDERKAQEKAAKAAKKPAPASKKPKKSSPEPVAEASPPIKAAQAAEGAGAKKTEPPGWPWPEPRKAARAQEEISEAGKTCSPAGAGNIETNATPNGTEPAAAETNAGESGTTADIESNETPKGKSARAVKYRHPTMPGLTWSGRGRQPKWVNFWITDGGTLDDLKTKEAA